MTDPSEAAAVAAATRARMRCVCQEAADASPCACQVPVSREQVGRLRAYAALHPERVIAYSELAGGWMTVLHARLPEGLDPFVAWLAAPFDVPPEADLRHANDLMELLDALGAPAAAMMS